MFLQQYWQQYAPSDAPEKVIPAEESAEMQAVDGEMLDLDPLDELEPETGRDPIPSVMVGLSEFEDALPSLPGGLSTPVPLDEGERAADPTGPVVAEPDLHDGMRRTKPEQGGEAPEDEDEEDDPLLETVRRPASGVDERLPTSEFEAVMVAEPPSEREEVLAQMSGDDALDRQFDVASQALKEEEEGDDDPEALAPTRSATEIGAAVRRIEEEDAGESSGEIDVKKTAQFNAMVLADDVDTSIWDFSDESLRRRSVEGEGEIIADRYRIIEPLAAGGMARIYRVQHLNLGKEFALKIIHGDLSSDAQMRKAFIREARVSSLFDHPNIVQVTDFGVDDSHGAYIVLEFLKGETLHDRLSREGHMRLPLALDIGLQVAEALHYMHQQNIIHCDIKPENIFLSEPPRERRRRVVVKLIDFGLSRREAFGAQLASSEVGGTPHFMAPEQIRGLAPQPSMDIYSLGILLYEMVVGELPFDGKLNEILGAQMHTEPKPPSKMMEEPLDEYVDQLILKALEKDPANRQPSMGQMIFEIRTVMEMLGFRSRRGRAEKKRPSLQDDSSIEEMVRVFDGCPCPLFRIDTEPKIIVVNRAFRAFLGGKGEDPVGKPLDTTRLGQFYPNLRMDVLAAALNKTPVQRVLTFRKDEDHSVSVMIWLMPEIDEATGITTFIGIIVPMGGLGVT